MIIVHCLPMFFSGGYLTFVFLLMFVFALIFLLVRR